MDRRGNGHSSITSDQEGRGRGCRTAGPLELRKEPLRSRTSRDVVFTTLHLLPRSEGEQCRPTASTLPRLLMGQQAHSRALAEAQKVSVNVIITKTQKQAVFTFILVFFHMSLSFQERSTHLTELLQKSRSDSNVLQNPKLRHKPRPPERCTGSGAQRAASCHNSKTRLHTKIESPIYNSSPCLTPGQQIQMSPSFQLGPRQIYYYWRKGK
uniref:Uncharacterized protein n=1 Tax=Seriola dumerili TaxID=41447 RepID=A0A3B4V0V6_SERDU